MKWTELDGEGEIETFTQVVVKPASFSEEPNYIVAIARLKEGVRALAWLTGVERENVKIGMKVKFVAKAVSGNRVSYEFIPI
ncbi:MAG: OB-fold domain-containing protein [Candidatus Bathyarchaeota archaeon]